MASFKHKQSALDAVKSLNQKNRDVFYRPIRIGDKGTWYRLYINRYATIQAAQAGISKLRQEGIIADAYVRRLDDTPGLQPANSPRKPPTPKKDQPRPPAARRPQTDRRPEPGRVTSPEAGIKKNQTEPLKIQDISVRLNDKEGDTAFIKADRYFWPLTQLNHDGPKTKLQVRVRNSGPFRKDLAPHASGGRYIQNGQVVYDADRNTLVLSLDLPGKAEYRITQVFNPAENIFSLRIRK
jgi:hypothetical protein